MKKALLLSTAIFLNATEITDLFQALKNSPDTKIDNILVKEMKENKNSIKSSLFPKVSLFSSIEHFSTPTSIKPMPPTTASKIGKNGNGYWFSQNITKVGFVASMPVFVKEIYDNKKRLDYIINSSKLKAKLNLIKREALLVELVSNLNYLFSLKDALNQKQTSIQTTYDSIKVGVKAGSIPEFKALRLKDALNQIKINISQIDSKMADIKSKIYNLTKQKIDKKIPIQTIASVQTKEFLAIQPLKEQLKNDDLNIKVQKDSFYPKVTLKTQGYRGFANAYNNGDSLGLNFASVGLYINWNIFDKSQSSKITKTKLEKLKDNLTLQKTIRELDSQVMKIQDSLKDTKKSISLTINSIGVKEELLKGAKEAFKLNTISVDEYLGYEDNLIQAKANLANLIATKNSLIANLAFIYGNNLERIFK